MDIAKFTALLEAQKMPEAKKLLEDFLHEDPTPEEKGAVLASVGMAYVNVKNKISQEYLQDLWESLDLLKQVDKGEREIDDEIKLAETRSKIGSE